MDNIVDAIKYYSPLGVHIDANVIRSSEGYHETVDLLKRCGCPMRIAWEMVEDQYYENWGKDKYCNFESFKTVYYRNKRNK